ncbi:MAG: hypothetical protein JST30_12835 [Armatimonadetes bacterium]|nr:hypothetical protein [Armatimonadota bacterium]
MKQFHKIGFSTLLAASLVLTAWARPAAAPTFQDGSEAPQAASQSFSLQWAAIESFMNAHVVVDNPSTRNDLENEAQLGIKSWSVAGPELGWPTSFGAGTLKFDSVAAALLCSVMILAIVP